MTRSKYAFLSYDLSILSKSASLSYSLSGYRYCKADLVEILFNWFKIIQEQLVMLELSTYCNRLVVFGLSLGLSKRKSYQSH